MINKMKQMSDQADKDVLNEIIQLMGKLNGGSIKDDRPEVPGQIDVEAAQLPGENPSEIPEGEEDKRGLSEALAPDSSEVNEEGEGDMDSDDDYDAEMQLRRKGKIF